ncbi:MAG: DUF4238 domain-containing protein [Patescibacteria group bacterium]
MAEQITAKQHFAPKFYFKRFAASDNLLQVLDIKNAKIVKSKPYSGVCYADFYYAQETGVPDEVSQEIETFLKQTEDIIAPDYDRIAEDILNYKPISEEDQYRLAWFMAALWMRNPMMRENINKMNEDMRKQIFKKYAHFPGFDESVHKIMKQRGEAENDELVKQAKELFQSGDYELKIDNTSHLNLMTDMKGFVNLVLGKKWRIYISLDERFITSDTPVIEIFPERKGPYGPTFLERKHVFVMTPKIVIEMIDPNLPGKKIKRKQINLIEAEKINLDRVKWSYKYGYSKEADSLQKMLGFYQGNKIISYLVRDFLSKNQLQ